MFRVDKNPGPGTYEDIALNPSGIYSVSKFKSSHAPRMHSQVTLAQKINNSTCSDGMPGPTDYKIDVTFNNK